MLKTFAFLGGIVVIVIMAVAYFGGAKPDPEIAGQQGYETIDINTLAGFYYDEFLKPSDSGGDGRSTDQIPEKILQLNGKRGSITGFIMPVRVDEEGNVREFALNGNYDMCFYGAPSRLNQWVHVRMQPGTAARFSHSPTTIMGTLEVGELFEDGEVISLYRLTGEKAVTATRGLFR